MKGNNDKTLQETQNQTETAPEALADEQMEQVDGGGYPIVTLPHKSSTPLL